MFMIKYLPKIFKTPKRDENTTLIYIEKKILIVVSCIVILFQFRKF